MSDIKLFKLVGDGVKYGPKIEETKVQNKINQVVGDQINAVMK